MYLFSKRETYLLVILVFLLVTVSFWNGILQAELEEYMDVKEALEQERKVHQEMEILFEKMESTDVRMEELKEEFSRASDGYYTWMSSCEAGREMVRALDACHLRSGSMTIDRAKAFSDESLLYIIEIHGLAEGTKEEILCFLEWVSENKAANFTEFRVMPQKEGDYQMEYDVEFYMIGKEFTKWRN